MHIGLPTLEFTAYVNVKKAWSNMMLKQTRVYMECLEVSLQHRLCTDIISVSVYKNLCTTIISNSLALSFLLRLCQCCLLKGGPRTAFVKMVLSMQWSTCEAIFVIFILSFCGCFGFDSQEMIIEPIQQNSVNPTQTGPYGCQIVRYARLSGSFYR
jgi:hypothetical protein